MKAISIDPNNGKYFVDRSDINFSDTMYQGTYNYTPVYPRYTFYNSGRFNYTNHQNYIEFITMLPIKRLLNNYFVEVRFRFIINSREERSLNIAIEEFIKFCEMNKEKLNVNALLS